MKHDDYDLPSVLGILLWMLCIVIIILCCAWCDNHSRDTSSEVPAYIHQPTNTNE